MKARAFKYTPQQFGTPGNFQAYLGGGTYAGNAIVTPNIGVYDIRNGNGLSGSSSDYGYIKLSFGSSPDMFDMYNNNILVGDVEKIFEVLIVNGTRLHRATATAFNKNDPAMGYTCSWYWYGVGIILTNNVAVDCLIA